MYLYAFICVFMCFCIYIYIIDAHFMDRENKCQPCNDSSAAGCLDTATLTLAVVSTFHTALARSADAATKARHETWRVTGNMESLCWMDSLSFFFFQQCSNANSFVTGLIGKIECITKT